MCRKALFRFRVEVKKKEEFGFLVIGDVGLRKKKKIKTFKKTWAAGAGSARKEMPLAGEWRLATAPQGLTLPALNNATKKLETDE